MADSWDRCTKAKPCPICGREKWCSVGEVYVHCMTEPSKRPAGNGEGWLHLRTDVETRPSRQHTPQTLTVNTREWDAEAHRYASQITDEQVARLADELGVEASALRSLGIGFGAIHNTTTNGETFTVESYVFPMFGADGSVCGLRTRNPRTGQKFAVKDSQVGILRRRRPTDGLLLICEGESDTAAAMSYGFDAIGRPGVTTCPEIAAKYARDHDAVIVADNDGDNSKVDAGLARLQQEVVATARSVRVINPPAGTKDLREWRQRGATLADIQAAIETAPVLDADDLAERDAIADESLQDGRRDIIHHTPEGDVPLHQVVPEAIKLLGARSRNVYVSAMTCRLVQVVAPDDGHLEVTRQAAPRVHQLTRAVLRERLDAVAAWKKVTISKDGKRKVRETLAPLPVCEATLERGEWPEIPKLVGVTTAPVLRRDGSVLNTAGYDPATRLLYAPSCAYPAIPLHPDAAQMATALETLLEPFAEFPFATDADRAALLAYMLTIAARPAIEGPTPLTCATAPTPGTGKTLAINASTTAMTGRDPQVLMWPGGRPSDVESEMRKRIGALAMEAPTAALIDNVPDGTTLQSASLAAALSANNLTERTLGRSETLSEQLRIVWSATGNNIHLAADLARRSLNIELDARMETPHLRTGFRVANLQAHVKADHPQMLAAALTLLRGFIAAGRPSHGKPALGGFEEWDTLVRSAVVFATGHDPLLTQERLRAESPESNALGALIDAWDAVVGEERVRAADLLSDSTPASGRSFLSQFGPLLAEACGTHDGQPPTAVKLGQYLNRVAGQVVRGRRIETAGRHQGTKVWRLCRIEKEGA